jgi:hypothetical protein
VPGWFNHATLFPRREVDVQRICLSAVLVLMLSACAEDWSEDQQAVHKAMRDWSAAVTAKDANAMWEMLSPDAREIYRRELEAPGGARTVVRMNKLALENPDSKLSPERRKQLEADLATLPPNPDGMSAQEYYVWRVTPDLTAAGAENTAGLFAKANVTAIEIDGDRATVVLKNGDPDRISWVRHEGHWKFDLKPSTLRALEEVREKEGKQN